jgi:hypothetical protein
MPTAYVAWRARASKRVVVPVRQAWNRFLCSLKGFQIRAQFIPELTQNRIYVEKKKQSICKVGLKP